jgi:FMN phosphatase YigB (HAD superfamily)
MVEGLIFDVGGVLAYDVADHLFYDPGGLIDAYQLDQAKVEGVVDELWQRYAYSKVGDESNWQEVERSYWEEFKEGCQVNAPNDELIDFSQRFVKPVPGMREVLERARDKQFDLLICSNNTEFWFQRQSQVVGFGEFFLPDKIVLSNHVGASKSEPSLKLFREVEVRMDHLKSNYVYVDDRSQNIARGLEAGVSGILFPQEAGYGAEYLSSILNKISGF